MFSSFGAPKSPHNCFVVSSPGHEKTWGWGWGVLLFGRHRCALTQALEEPSLRQGRWDCVRCIYRPCLLLEKRNGTTENPKCNYLYSEDMETRTASPWYNNVLEAGKTRNKLNFISHSLQVNHKAVIYSAVHILMKILQAAKGWLLLRSLRDAFIPFSPLWCSSPHPQDRWVQKPKLSHRSPPLPLPHLV